MRTGGQILIDALRINGCDTIFGVPGESYLTALDAIHGAGNALRYITCRQEGGACFMAAAHADVTGDIGVCFVTRGPGATNASVGLHTAFQGSTPLILLVGQILTRHRDREAFQELDYRRVFGQMTKWVAEVDDPARIPEYVNRAVRTARAGRPGPVVLALPEDVLRAETEARDLPPVWHQRTPPPPEDMRQLGELHAAARRPLMLLGGNGWTEDGYRAIHAAAERHALAVAVGFRRQGLFDHDHENYIGTLGFGGEPSPNRYIRDCDLVIAVGTRLDDGTTLKFSLIEAPVPRAPLVHVHPGPEELGRLYQPTLGIQADENSFAVALATMRPTRSDARVNVCRNARAAYLEMQRLPAQSGPVDMGHVMHVLSDRMPADAVMTTGAGNASDWPNIYYRYRSFRGALAPISGAMGFGVPAAIAAKVAFPHRMSVYVGGDGDFLMNGQELATAVQYGLNPIFVIVDNCGYGTIRMHQEQRFPGRPSGTALRNPDFAVVAQGYGAHGEIVERTSDFAPAFERAVASAKAAVIHVKVGPDHLGPNMTVSSLKPRADRTT